MSTESILSNGISPTRDRVLGVVRQIVGEELGIDPDKIRENDTLDPDLGCDSLGKVEIMMEVEEQFGITVSDEEMDERIRTVGDIVDGVLQLLGQETGA